MSRTIKYCDEIVKAQKQWKDIYSYAPKIKWDKGLYGVSKRNWMQKRYAHENLSVVISMQKFFSQMCDG